MVDTWHIGEDLRIALRAFEQGRTHDAMCHAENAAVALRELAGEPRSRLNPADVMAAMLRESGLPLAPDFEDRIAGLRAYCDELVVAGPITPSTTWPQMK